MQRNNLRRIVSQIYLSLIPLVTLLIGLFFSHGNYKIYIPLMVINVFVVIIAVRSLSSFAVKWGDIEIKRLIIIATLLIIPWILLSVLAEIGAPPFDNPAVYVATAVEQQVRYIFLLVGGVLIAFGFALLREKLRKSGEEFYSWIGLIAIMMAIPLFILNMAYYNSFLLEAFKIQVASASDKMPEWFTPFQAQMKI